MAAWDEITRTDAYQNLSPAGKSFAKTEFFKNNIAPVAEKQPGFENIGHEKLYDWFMQQPDDSGQGQISSMLGSAARGFSEVVPGAIQGLGALTGISPLETAGESIRSGIESVAPVNPLYAESIPVKAAGVVGQIGSVLGTGGIGGLAGKALGAERIAAGATAAEQALATTNAVTKGANAALYGSAGLQGAASGAQLADQYGLQGGNRYANILAGAAGEIGSEMLPFGLGAETAAAKRILGAAPQTGRALGAIASEAGEEGINQLWQNAALKTLAPEGANTPGLTEGVLESAAYGGLGGGILAGVNVATGAYKQPANEAAAKLLHAASLASNDTKLTTAATDKQVQASVDATVANDLSRFQPPDPQVAKDFEEQLRVNEDENLFGLGLEAEQDKLRQQQAYAEAQQRQAQFEGLSQNEPAITAPVGGAIPAVGQEETTTDQLAGDIEGTLPEPAANGSGILPTEQPQAVGPASSEGVARNAEVIRQAAARLAGTEQGPNLNFPQVQPTVAEQPVERKYTVANVKTGKVVSRPDEPMTHKEAITFRSKFSQPNNFTLVDVTNEQPISPQGVAPTGIATQTGQPMSGDSGIARDATKPEQMTPAESYEAYTTAKYLAPNLADMPKTRRQIQEGAAIAESSGIKDPKLQKTLMDSAKAETGQFAGPYIKVQRIRLIEEAIEDQKPVSAEAVDTYSIKLPEGYTRQGELYVYSPNSPVAQKEPPLTPSGQVANEGGGPVTSNETEVGFQVQPPVETKETPDAEVSSGKVEAAVRHLEGYVSSLAPVGQKNWTPEVMAKAAKYFESQDTDDIRGLSSIQRTRINDSLKATNKAFADEVAAWGKAQKDKNIAEEKENARLEKEREKQAKETESRREAIDSLTKPTPAAPSIIEESQDAEINSALSAQDKQAAAQDLGFEAWGEVSLKAFKAAYADWLVSAISATKRLAQIFYRLANSAKSLIIGASIAISPQVGESTIDSAQDIVSQARKAPVEDIMEGQVRVTATIGATVSVSKFKGIDADFHGVKAPQEVVMTAQWVIRLKDNKNKPFLIASKNSGEVYVFDSSGRLAKKSPALFGQDRGDSLSGEKKITPSGRFDASIDVDANNEYNYGRTLDFLEKEDSVLAVHRVYLAKPEQKREDRLKSKSPVDNRISSGCINVPDSVFDRVIDPLFSASGGVVYVMPETGNPMDLIAGIKQSMSDSIVGTPTGVEIGAVSVNDGLEAQAYLNNTGDIPGILNAFVGTSDQFLSNPDNERQHPYIYAMIRAIKAEQAAPEIEGQKKPQLSEGFFDPQTGRSILITDGVGIDPIDRRVAEQLGISPAVAAAKRVLTHEALGHRGWWGLSNKDRDSLSNVIRSMKSPEDFDRLAKYYPELADWRTNPDAESQLVQEFISKTVESLKTIPKDGPLRRLVELLQEIWQKIFGKPDKQLTLKQLRLFAQMLQAGAKAPQNRTVSGGKVDIKESRPSFANPINAELARAAERFRQMNERQAVETPEGLKELFNPNAQGSGTTNKLFEQVVTPQQIRSEIRAAYDRAVVGSGSVQAPIQQVFDEAKTQIPTLTEKQFGEQLQALYEDGSAFLVPADRSDTMMAAGEKWGVYDASGMPASYVGIMPLEIRASRITNDSRSELPKDIKQQAKVITKLGGQALNSHRALKALRESQPKFHTKQESEPIVGVAVNIVEALEKNGVAPEELTEYLIDSDFLDELGIKMNDSLYQALAMEVYRTQLEKADALQEAGDNATANKLRQHVIATQNQWFKSGTEAGQQLRMRQSLMLNPRYQGLFLLSHLNEMIRENAEKTATAQTEIKADDIAEKATQAAEEATKVTADEFADITMDELDRLGEEQLDAGEKSSWAKIKGYIARLGASAIARLRKSGEIKASNAAESAGDLVKKFLAMSDAEHDADDAATHKALKAELASFLGKGTEAKKKVKKALVEGAEEKVKKPRAKKPKATAEEKAKRKEERANGVAQRLIYRTQELFRQGFKNEAKKSNADSILKAFREQVSQPMSDAAFTERLKKLNVTADVAQRMLNTAERERADHLRMEKNALLDSEEALKKIIKKLTDKLGVFQISPQSWKELFSTSTVSQEQRKEEMEAAIKADPIFQNLDADDQKLLADLLEEAWEAKRKDVFEAEIKRLTRVKKTSAEAAKALAGKDSTEKLLQLVNQGLLNNDEFYKAVAAKFGFKDLTQEQKDRLKEIAQELQKDDLLPHKRTQLAEEFKNTVEEVAQVPFAQIAADTWVTSVLTGWRTAVTIALAAESGGYQVISTALAEILKNTSDLNAWKTAGSAINAWISSMPRNARNALGYIWDGKGDRIDPTMSNLASYMDLDKKELSRVNTANSLLKSKNVFSRLLGHYLHFFQKFLTALDLFNAASAKEGSAPIAYYQTRKNREGPFDINEFAKLRDFKAARKHILNTEFGGVEPTSALERSRVDAWATQYMWQQISKLEGVLENANYNAQQGAMTLDPGGVGGMLYHAILSLQASQKKKAEDFLQETKIAALQAETTQEKLVAKNKMALAYLYQFAAYNMLGAVGLKFARYAGNRLNQTISFVPFLGLARLNEKKGVPQEMHSAQIIANQAMGFAVALGAYALLKAIADEPDEEKRGFGLSGSWDSLTPERKSQLMSSGKQPYTITIGGRVYKYNNWPMGGIIAAVGALADLAQYQPEKWNEKTLPGKLASGTLAALLSVGDSASLSQFSEMFGRSVQTRDPLDAAAHTLSKTAAGWAGGFIPRLLKDVDAYFSPEINRYKTPFEFMAREVPVYRRGVGKPLLDIFAEPVAPSRGPLSREFIEQPTEPEYRAIGRLNEHGVFLTPADPQNRLVGKGSNKRHMTDEEGLRYMQLTGKGYKEFVLRYSPKILSMPRDRARQFVLDKADEIRDRAAKKSIIR